MNPANTITKPTKDYSIKPLVRLNPAKDIIFIDPPIHTDQEIAYSILDDSLQGQEIPNGAHSIASLLSKNGIKTKIIITDAFLKTGKYKLYSPKQLYPKLKLLIDKKIQYFNPQVVAFNLMYTFTEPSVLEMTKLVKDKHPDKLVVVGGNHATFTADYLLNPNNKTGIDVVVRGEGEWTCLELMQKIKFGQTDLSQIRGISYCADNHCIQHNPSRPRGGLNKLPSLNYKLIDKPSEVSIANFNHAVMFSRACKGSCTFCTSPSMWQHRVSSISTDNFRNQLEFLINKQTNIILILDDDILVSGDSCRQIMAVLREIKKKYPGVVFFIQSRVDHFINYQQSNYWLALMRDAGIQRLYLGIESGSQSILDNMHKNLKLSWIKPACRNIKQAGIEAGAFWLIGHPGATPAAEQESLDFLTSLFEEKLLDDLEIHNVVPYPGTAISRDPRISIFDRNKKHYGFLNNYPVYDLVNPANNRTVMSAKQIKTFQLKTLELRKKYLGVPLNLANKPLIIL